MTSPKSGLSVEIFRPDEGCMGRGRENQHNPVLNSRLLITVQSDKYFGTPSSPSSTPSTSCTRQCCADKWNPSVALSKPGTVYPKRLGSRQSGVMRVCDAAAVTTWATWQHKKCVTARRHWIPDRVGAQWAISRI
ncbi:hypothetical protein Y032_0002g716 [Ancylostoma ceylanicum]|uniref:Uncharacterized protein n=1 Tax=Ancylostoma ceylanicum TaxID=53326 RepID=A0A016W0C4_9BILA|nr:hypothetical protein Y032_0002g716 [Ancylostoma ceylanicum]